MPSDGSHLVVLCGPPYSGKSTLAAALAARGAAVVSLDQILRADGLAPEKGLPVECWHYAFDVATEQVRATFDRSAVVVVDDTACYAFLRAHWRDVAAEAGHPMSLVVLHAPTELVLQRRAANQRTPHRPHVVDDVFEPHMATFDWPGKEESPLLFDPTRDPNDIAEAVLDALQAE